MKTMIANLIDEELLTANVQDETNCDFIQRICGLCIEELESTKAFSPLGFGGSVIDEIEREVTDIFRIKIYGHYNLAAFRRTHLLRRIS